MSTSHLSVGHYAHPGQQRELNEDSYLVLTSPALGPGLDALLVVADGMGGHQAGEIASQSLIEILDELFRSQRYRNIVAYNTQHEDYYVVVLKEVLEWANQQLFQLSATRAGLHGMGTTATVVLLANDICFWGHVGDSRAYLLHDGMLTRLTTDHTWVNEQVAAGFLTPEQAAAHPKRSVLTQSLAGSSLVRVERSMQRLHLGDRLLLCSDGLSGVVHDYEIQKVLTEEADPQTSCERLGRLANQRGGPDNITILTAYMVNGQPVRPIPSGRILGPAPTMRTNSTDVHDTHRSPPRLETTEGSRNMVDVKCILTALLGALLSGLVALLVTQFSHGKRLPLVACTVMCFLWGMFLGRFGGCNN